MRAGDEVPGQRPWVLVVDDEKDIVEYLTAVLEDAGYGVLGLNEADGALEATRRGRPDLVLLDIMMPGHTGLSLYQTLRGDPDTAGIPVVIISGFARQEDFRQMDLAAPGGEALPRPEGYLEKPISVPGLLSLLSGLLGGAGGRRAHG